MTGTASPGPAARPRSTRATAPAPGRKTIGSVGRGLQVLRAFRSELVPLSNAELVRRTGLPKATVSRLTTTLVHLGYLRPAAESRLFELAAGPLCVGHAYASGSQLLQVANPALQALADRLEMSATIAVPDGTDMLYIAYRASPRVSIRFSAGHLLPMGTSAIGHAWLWGLAPTERAARLAELRRASSPPQWPAVEARIRESFAELDATGTCAVLSAFNRNTFGVALPLRVGRARHLVSMSCGKARLDPDLEVERRRITPALKEAAAALEGLLASVEGPP